MAKEDEEANVADGMFLDGEGHIIGAMVIDGKCRFYTEACDDDNEAAHLVIHKEDVLKWCRLTGLVVAQAMQILHNEIDNVEEALSKGMPHTRALKKKRNDLMAQVDDLGSFCMILPQVYHVNETAEAKRRIVEANGHPPNEDRAASMITDAFPTTAGLLSNLSQENLDRLRKEVAQEAIMIHMPIQYMHTLNWIAKLTNDKQTLMHSALSRHISNAPETVLMNIPKKLRDMFGH